ncbi:CRISPR-associated protein Cas7/Cst2/DevR, subtype I-B/TNEAP-like protein [Leptospira weilii serovar Ranarum str. ICFT]|uniref:CRISPR-associated protein Cas7/Cst2/DevR, subtype I-B/TNEAP-like protein n=1 Tax=Leptospira weilii serovar Ranarum str. ICFT TaxID=1218598 RepID=N1WQM9_9LEPT|nr:type I-B CRISPR-associated protein Cas7/Cst2/DevR [Leptospira weilii]EMY79552.1 CRISPR-associated protein Cas7/Cst2/DevR, subtype I-B/TNEAP-like protein [Leptospira weilii serovar Ranarum str. ICFT]
MTTQNNKNLFCTVLTYAAPSSNYRGESEENRTVLQKINKNGKDYAIFSSESIRNAIREIVSKKLSSKEINRTRLHNEGQPTVKFNALPDAEKYADDFIFGYLVTGTVSKKFDSVLRTNYAVALSPYKYEASFHQSPDIKDSPFKNQKSSVLLHKEISHTAVQYPFALAGQDCRKHPDWIKALLDSIGELNNVAGGHTRNLYDFTPKSIVVRLTPKLVAGYDAYGFKEDGSWSELSRIKENDLPRDEFYFAGEMVRNMKDEDKARLNPNHLFENPDHLIEKVKTDFLG